MEPIDQAKEIVDTLLGYLGFVVHVTKDETTDGPALQIFTEEAEWLIGRRGERLDDIQYLVNRILQTHAKNAPRIRIDVEHFRTMREDDLIGDVQGFAEKVRATGRPVKLHPMNSYNRRIIHHLFADDPEIESWSPPDRAPLKQIILRRRQTSSGPNS
jgi:spoIIIJ-associated protein